MEKTATLTQQRQKVNEWTNPELTKEGVVGGTVKYSFDIWNQAIAWCRELGIKIMIDIHSAETASAGHQVNLWYTDKFSTEDWFGGTVLVHRLLQR